MAGTKNNHKLGKTCNRCGAPVYDHNTTGTCRACYVTALKAGRWSFKDQPRQQP